MEIPGQSSWIKTVACVAGAAIVAGDSWFFNKICKENKEWKEKRSRPFFLIILFRPFFLIILLLIKVFLFHKKALLC